ncbi:YdcH family protein [Pontixanthobacter sp. CEM42]|uniref:YdcH family protein n=1 Tax=Pontixanthobacter sp. CEM42 TaxID=2792077 RepID=UPI001ADFC860|nr:YdcH family protein [Pontixanthobacter sp. CEM42]
MKNYLKKLRQRHRRIDRLIDTSKSYGKQDEVKVLKRIRLQLKDRIAEVQAGRRPVPQ